MGHVKKFSLQQWMKLLFVVAGLFGIAFAVAGLVVPLPNPAVGGTCGPGVAAEAPIAAVLNPGSIGAGPEPAATDVEGHQQWLAFIGECQATADGRTLAAVLIVLGSAGLVVGGPKLVDRTSRTKRTPAVAA
jgi:hypothetical protein